MDKVKLRCSQLPKFMLCAGSAIPVRNPIIEAEPEFNDPAELGTAVHAGLGYLVKDAEYTPDISDAASLWRVDADDLAQLYGYGKRCWGMLSEHFGEHPIAEQHFKADFGTFILSGHPDMLSDDTMDVRAVGDWKSGRVEYDARWQLYGAAILTPATRGVIVWLRETWTGNPFEVVAIPPEDAIIDHLTAQVKKLHKGECTTGPHCRAMYCERQHECEAYQGMLAADSTALVELDEGETLPAIEVVRRGYEPWKNMVALCERYKDLMNEVLDAQGDVTLLNGNTLTRMTTHPKSFDAQKALAVMEDFGIENTAECFKVAVTKLSKLVKDGAKAAGAKKGAHLTAFFEACEEAGALTYGERKMRKEIRASK